VGQIGSWERLYQEQIHSLCFSGLYEACDYLHVGINGNQPLPQVLPKMNLTINNNHFLESDTLKSLWDYANNNENIKILYFHTKGLSREQFAYNVNAWRLYLEYFNIHNWKDCLSKLDKYDCVGTEWVLTSALTDPSTNEPLIQHTPHYAGNFWWATSNYIKKLDPNYIYNPCKGWTKWKCELWIGTKNPNHYNYFSTDDDPKYYYRTYSPEKYMLSLKD
jgi:hypothetical protein